MAAEHVLVLGGARSGKTTFAERLAMRIGQKPVYLATAEALDREMRERVETHRRARAGRFATIEEPINLTDALIESSQGVRRDPRRLPDALDHQPSRARRRCRRARSTSWWWRCSRSRRARVILVSNEVGLGIVPDNALARTFRDLAGAAHQRLAEICDDVYFVAAGLPLTLKGSPPPALSETTGDGVHQA